MSDIKISIVPLLASTPERIDSEHEIRVVERVKDICARGNVARFSRKNRFSGTTVVKHVSSPEVDELGDMTAEWWIGSTEFVCPGDPEYLLTELTRAIADIEQENYEHS